MKEILALIDAEVANLQRVRALLTGASSTSVKRGPGRPPKTATPVVKKKTRNLSPEGRARIAAAVKARWAKQKKASAK